MVMEVIEIKSSTVLKVLGKGIEYFRNKRINKLVEDLRNGDIEISDDSIKSESFLSSFISTVDAIQKASGHQKVKFLTNLFIVGVKEGYLEENTDEFHELLSIVGGLSEKELLVLAKCGDFLPEAVFNLDQLNDLAPEQKNKQLINVLIKEQGMSEGDAVATISGLQRTGFLIPLSKASPLPQFLLTEKYVTLKKYILHINEFY